MGLKRTPAKLFLKTFLLRRLVIVNMKILILWNYNGRYLKKYARKYENYGKYEKHGNYVVSGHPRETHHYTQILKKKVCLHLIKQQTYFQHIFVWTFLFHCPSIIEGQWNHSRLKLPCFVNCFKIDFIL